MSAALAVLSAAAALAAFHNCRLAGLFDVGRLALLLLVGRAGVDRAVELVLRQFLRHVLA